MPLPIHSEELEEKIADLKAAGYKYSDQEDLRIRWLELELERLLTDDELAARVDALAGRLEKLAARVAALETGRSA